MKLPESLRDNLLALGIPEELHTLEGLAAFFPPEFRMDGMELDAVVLAGMLLRFAESGLIQPQARIPARACRPESTPANFTLRPASSWISWRRISGAGWRTNSCASGWCRRR